MANTYQNAEAHLKKKKKYLLFIVTKRCPVYLLSVKWLQLHLVEPIFLLTFAFQVLQNKSSEHEKKKSLVIYATMWFTTGNYKDGILAWKLVCCSLITEFYLET